jgi:hypothetical protein
MAEEGDPFTGAWNLCPERSKLSTPLPRKWAQRIEATAEEIEVQENIVSPHGAESLLSVRAKFDGRDYPVQGSPIVETIAYTRTNRNSISGIGKKDGAVSLTETAAVDSEGRTLTLSYSIHLGAEVVASGVAVFEKQF